MAYDEYGNYMNDPPPPYRDVNVYGTLGEQNAAGVNASHFPLDARNMVRNQRFASGLDMDTGRPREPIVCPTPSPSYGYVDPGKKAGEPLPVKAGVPYDSYDGSKPRAEKARSSSGIFGFLRSPFRIVVLLMVIPVGLVVFKGYGEERWNLSQKVEHWTQKRSIERAAALAEFAPISAYAAFGPKGARPELSAEESEPGALAKKATALLHWKKGQKKISDKDMAKWGFAAWGCLSRNPECLVDAEASGNDPERLMSLGLLFLDYASSKGSPDADADFGLYIAGPGWPEGRNHRWAIERWSKGAENPEDTRSTALLEASRTSLWVAAGHYASVILLTNI